MTFILEKGAYSSADCTVRVSGRSIRPLVYNQASSPPFRATVRWPDADNVTRSRVAFASNRSATWANGPPGAPNGVSTSIVRSTRDSSDSAGRATRSLNRFRRRSTERLHSKTTTRRSARNQVLSSIRSCLVHGVDANLRADATGHGDICQSTPTSGCSAYGCSAYCWPAAPPAGILVLHPDSGWSHAIIETQPTESWSAGRQQ